MAGGASEVGTCIQNASHIAFVPDQWVHLQFMIKLVQYLMIIHVKTSRTTEVGRCIQNASHTAFVPDQRLHLQFMIKHKMCEYLYHFFVAWNMPV